MLESVGHPLIGASDVGPGNVGASLCAGGLDDDSWLPNFGRWMGFRPKLCLGTMAVGAYDHYMHAVHFARPFLKY